MQKLKGGHRPQHHHRLSEPLDEQMASMHLSQPSESYLHKAFRELEEQEIYIDKLKVDMSALDSAHQQSSHELEDLTTRVDWMERRMRSSNSTNG
jgi:predicted  nucleic acid-binding Zn-ribbon protein